MCSSQDMRRFEYDILVSVRKAKKLKWLLQSVEEDHKKEEILNKVKVLSTDAG